MPVPSYATGGTSPTAKFNRSAPASTNEAELAQALDELQGNKGSGGGGFLNGLKKAGGSLLKAIDIPRSIVVSGASELGDVVAQDVLHRDNGGGGASWHDFTEGVKNHIGAGEIVEDSGLLGDNKWAKRAVGGALDIGSDPTNAVTFGSGSAAKEGLAKAGQVLGDDVARTALREGGTQGLRDALEKAGSSETLEDVLARGTADGAKGARNVERTLTDLDKTGKGGLGIGGYRTGLGQGVADNTFKALRESDIGKGVRPLFQTTAKVRDAEGVGAASAVKNTLADAAQAKRLGAQETAESTIGLLDESGRAAFDATPKGERLQFLRDTADAVAQAKSDVKNIDRQAAREAGNKGVELLSDAKGTYDAAVKTKVNHAVVGTLLEQAPELVSNVPKAGYVDLGNGYHIKQVVQDALDGATSASPSDLVKGIDAATSALKRYTTLGPLNAIPHVSRNIFSNMLFATMYGGVKGIEPWREVGKARDALQGLLKEEIPVTADALVEKGLTRDAAERAVQLHQAGLVGRGGATFDDIGNLVPEAGTSKLSGGKEVGKLRTAARKVSGEEGMVGTRTASRVNEWHEELSRGAVFLQGLDDGLSPSVAARKSRDAMLDYSNEALTPFERNVLQRTLFFYKFPRRAVPAGIKFAIEHPGEAVATSRLGLGVDLGKRNEYGDPLGFSFDTPLESTYSTTADFVKNPADAAVGMANPLIKAALDDKERSWDKVIPPIGQAGKRAEHLGEGQDVSTTLFSPGGGLLGPTFVPGGRIGVDYSAKENVDKDAKAQATAESRLKAGKTPSAKDRLTALARKGGVENPGALTQPNLLKAMAEAGIPSKDILAALKTPVRT